MDINCARRRRKRQSQAVVRYRRDNLNIDAGNVSVYGTQIISNNDGSSQCDELVGQNICYGGTQIVISPLQKEQQDRWDDEVSTHVKGCTWTSVCTAVDERLQLHSTLVITGCPGEGKTTLGYLLADKVRRLNWTVFLPKTPEEYFACKFTNNTIVMLNDLWGAFDFEESNVRKWIPVLEDVKSRLDQSDSGATFGTIEERMQTRLVKLICVSREYIWKDTKPKLGKYVNNIFRHDSIINISKDTQLQPNDKLEIIKSFEQKFNLTLSKTVSQKMIDVQLPHGFPHCCELFFNLQGALSDPEAFFQHPIAFLNETLGHIIQDKSVEVVFSLLLKHDGRFNVHSLGKELTFSEPGLPPIKTKKIRDILKRFEGSYFRREGRCVTFAHPSIYESVASTIGSMNPAFLVEFSSISCLKDWLVIHNDNFHPGLPGNIISESDETLPLLINRFLKEIESGNMCEVLSHSVFGKEDFVVRFLERTNIQDLINSVDVISGLKFLFLVSSCGKNTFLRNIITSSHLSSDQCTEALCGCCHYGNEDGAMQLLSQNQAGVCSSKNNKGDTPLICATRAGNWKICRLLVEKGASMTSVNGDGDCALHLAAESGNQDLTGLLLNRSTRNIRNRKGETALHKAAMIGHKGTVDIILDNGADRNVKTNDGLTALYIASQSGFEDIVESLLRKGASVDLETKIGNTALFPAAERGHCQIVQMLLGHDSDLNHRNMYGVAPIYYTCRNNDLDLFDLLAANGANIDVENKQGVTPIMVAALYGNTELTNKMFSDGVRKHHISKDGSSLLHFAVRSGSAETVKLILNKACKTDVQEKGQKTPLHIASELGHLDIVSELLSWGADTNQVDDDRRSALHFACFGGLTETAEQLLDAGADPDAVDFLSNTPLHIASAKGFPTLCELLLERGADPNIKDKQYRTALHFVAKHGNLHCARILLQTPGIKRNVLNIQSYSPLDYAMQYDNPQLSSLMQEYGCKKNMIGEICDAISLFYLFLGIALMFINILTEICLHTTK
ncbi:putative ankyrin repeat protein RF_0381 [Haliotis asinina]|uniref:putative ankyrin repeat protein RF_0381 n=1 Tax=Haliotis asinina TaxID=109174 RepID=UPI003531E90D